MNPQADPNFDLLSFQRLLEAAWVLQCRQDAGSSAPHENPAPSIAIDECMAALEHDAEPDYIAAADQVAFPELAVEPEYMAASAHFADLEYDEAEELAPLALVDDLPEPSPIAVDESTAEPITEPLEIALVPEIQNDPALFVPAAARSRHITLSFAMMAVEPFFVLLIIFLFLLTQAWPPVDRAFAHTPETPAPIAQAAQPPVTDDSTQLIPAALTEPAIPATAPNTAAVLSTLPVQSTHRRVTDPATSSTLHDLSRYEIQTLRRQAQDGDAAAAFTLAMAYESGHLLTQSCAKAATWVKKSAKEGNAAAQYNLGLRYRYGDGIRANARQARRWMQKAAAKGYPRAAPVLSATN
jgi:hypothetical protein